MSIDTTRVALVPLFGADPPRMVEMDKTVFPSCLEPKKIREKVFWVIPKASYVSLTMVHNSLPHCNPGTLNTTVSQLVASGLVERDSESKPTTYRRKTDIYLDPKGRAVYLNDSDTHGVADDPEGDVPQDVQKPPVKAPDKTSTDSTIDVPTERDVTPVALMEELLASNDRLYIIVDAQRHALKELSEGSGLTSEERADYDRLLKLEATLKGVLK